MDLPGHQQPLAEVRIEVAGEGCKPLTPTYSLAPEPIRTVIGAKRLKPGHGIDPNGFWQEDLVPNSLLSPPGTAYRITRETSDGSISVSCISVPASGGPFFVSELLIPPPIALPVAPPSTELAVAEDLVGVVGLGPFNGFNMVGLANLVIPIPLLDRPIYVWAKVWAEHSAANAVLATFIAPVGTTIIGGQLGSSLGFVGAAGKETQSIAWARIPANGGPLNLQAFLYSDIAGTATAFASATDPMRIAAVVV